MPNFRNIFSLFFGIIIGSLLYVVLNLIPIVGPLAVGVIAGKISNAGMKRGFFVGLFSGILGFVLFSLILYKEIYAWNFFGKILVGGLLLVWNFFAIVFAGIGGILGAGLFRRKEYEVEEKNRKTLVLCKKCKVANPKGGKYCNSCGERL